VKKPRSVGDGIEPVQRAVWGSSWCGRAAHEVGNVKVELREAGMRAAARAKM